MKTQAGYVQGYNAQAVVTEDQIIVAAEVTQEANDIKQLHPMLERAQANLNALAHPQAVGTALADAGYCSEANLLAADSAGPELLIATNKDWKQRKVLREQPGPRRRIPMRLSHRERMERVLLTKRGRRLYKKRGQTVEPVFGQIKSVRGCDGFMRRGTAACTSEWKLLCATHNLLKLWRNGQVGWIRRRTGRVPQRFGRRSGKKTGDHPLEGPAPSRAQQEKARLGVPRNPCWVPDSSIMGLSNRLYTFKFIPPAATETLKVPNSCNSCHTDKTVEWAKDALKTWPQISPWRVAQ